MKQWIEGLKSENKKKPMPLLSFPSVSLLGISVRELIADSELQARGMAAVAEAVADAVRSTEERLLGHIRARGQRPSEVGTGGGAGIRMHPAVNRLTRRERAMLAKRAENGETVKL
jgi:hypothetical protein